MLHDQLSTCCRMSSHYRRLYGSRNVVDTSPPHALGLRHGSRNAGGKKGRHACSAHTHQAFVSAKSQNYRCVCDEMNSDVKHKPPKLSSQSYTPRTLKPRESYDLLERHADHFVTARNAFQPRILKSVAESKVRLLRTYHPPRSKDSRLVAVRQTATVMDEDDCLQGDWQITCEDNLHHLEQVDVRSRSVQSDAKGSSCDSAYSGGASSGRESCRSALEHRQDDDYVKFIHEITEDVLQQGVFSNQDLKLLFLQHISKNESLLDKKRMEKEVQKLSEELGMCEEVLSSFGNLSTMTHIGRSGSFIRGDKQRAGTSRSGDTRLPNVVVADEKLSCSESCHRSRTCTSSLAPNPGNFSTGHGCVCVCERSRFPREAAASVLSQDVGSEIAVTEHGYCCCKQHSKMQMFWMNISNTHGLPPTSSRLDKLCC